MGVNISSVVSVVQYCTGHETLYADKDCVRIPAFAL